MKGDTFILSQIYVMITEEVNDMAKLKCKSVRFDITCTADDVDIHWDWAPDRDIKVKAISWVIDIPDGNGTIWHWLSRGAVTMGGPDPGPNEEEMILLANHTRGATGEGTRVSTLFVDFGVDHMEVLDGEKIYMSSRGSDTKKDGHSICIYYLG